MAWTEEDLERMLGRGQVRLASEVRQPALAQLPAAHLVDIWQSAGVTLQLPLSPSVNRYWRSIISGSGTRVHVKVLISLEGRRYRIDAGRRFLAQWPQQIPRPLEGRLRVTVAVFPADKRAFDIDNRLKALLDFLQVVGAYRNDNQIDDLRIVRYGPVQSPGELIVQLTCLQ